MASATTYSDLQFERTTDQPQPFAEQIRNTIRHESQMLLRVADHIPSDVDKLVERLARCAGTVAICGIGKTAHVASKISATMRSIGVAAEFLDASAVLHGDGGPLNANDVVLILSASGETRETCEAARHVKASHKAYTVALTCQRNSTLARIADYCFCLGSVEEADDHSLLPTASTTAMLAVGDALSVVLARLRGFTAENFARSHPGGSLGNRLCSVSTIMRPTAALRITHQDVTVLDAIRTLKSGERRSGAILVTDSEGRLAGIFTDTDLVRLLEFDGDVDLDREIREVMTSDPISISESASVSEAISIISENSISELPVTDVDGSVVGLVDITDIADRMPGTR